MNRRDFLTRLSTVAAAALVLDPDLALWVPGRKTIFLPSAPAIWEDHTAALQAMINRLGAGGVLQLQPGATYHITKTLILPNGFTVNGDGHDHPRLVWKGPSDSDDAMFSAPHEDGPYHFKSLAFTFPAAPEPEPWVERLSARSRIGRIGKKEG